ncbi:MAG: glutathione synthase, partial [Coxiellaceae bacterium]|nr:glutathione synthase [Coxiellaceae bacterium]
MKLGILMDPIAEITIEKDTSFALLLEAQQRGFEIYYMEPQDVWLQDGISWGRMRLLNVEDDPDDWFTFKKELTQPLVDLDLFLMRKDPPFDMQYIYLTYLLEQAESQGLTVINKPASLRDANEKLFTAWFPQCCPNTIVTRRIDLLKEFVASEEQVVVKPLGAMGGESIFIVNDGEPNTNVILETMTRHESELVMAQRYIAEISEGDKRILMIHGEPVPYALARIPQGDDFRGNIAAGGKTEGRELTDRDLWICEQVGPTL